MHESVAPTFMFIIACISVWACASPRDAPRPTAPPDADVTHDVLAPSPREDSGMEPTRDATVGAADAQDAGVEAADAQDAWTDAAGPRPPLVLYVGSGFYSEPSALRTFRIREEAGELEPLGAPIPTPVAPTYLVTRAPSSLFATIENSPGLVMAFSIDSATHTPVERNRVNAGGDGSTHIALDRDGLFVFESHYNSGNVTVLPVDSDGRVGSVVDTLPFGANANAHGVLVLPSNRHVLVALKGQDRIAQLLFDPSSGRLSPNTPAFVDASSASGPRHLALHPSGAFVYVINELASTISMYAVDTSRGTLTHGADVSSLPSDASGVNSAAEIAVHPQGTFVFSSNRGNDSIAVHAIDPGTGRLAFIEAVPSGGRTPRTFALDPTGAWLVVANQDSDDLRLFAVDPHTGRITPTGAPVSILRPTGLAFAPP